MMSSIPSGGTVWGIASTWAMPPRRPDQTACLPCVVCVFAFRYPFVFWRQLAAEKEGLEVVMGLLEKAVSLNKCDVFSWEQLARAQLQVL